jgi:hypothetical protein
LAPSKLRYFAKEIAKPLEILRILALLKPSYSSVSSYIICMLILVVYMSAHLYAGKIDFEHNGAET